jgi:SAM-dependent methyltransferase
MANVSENHDAVTIDQFTRTADSFAALHTPRSDADLLDRIRSACRLNSDSVVLDVACGPGLVAFTLAECAGHVTGVDLTPAMLDKARALQRPGQTNLSWQVGRADALSFAEATFDVVVTRFSFHHLTNPAAALAEMVRVCRPGGRVVVCDVYTTTPEQAAEYDRLERLRDPSHVRALPLEELRRMMVQAGMAQVEEERTTLPMELDALLTASSPVPGGAEEIRRALAADEKENRLGLGVRQVAGRCTFAFLVVVLAGSKPVGP